MLRRQEVQAVFPATGWTQCRENLVAALGQSAREIDKMPLTAAEGASRGYVQNTHFKRLYTAGGNASVNERIDSF